MLTCGAIDETNLILTFGFSGQIFLLAVAP